MIRKIFTTIIAYLEKKASIGTYPGMSYLEERRTRLLNLIALPCIPLMFFFCIVNLVQGRYILSAINLANTLSSIFVLVLHYHRRYYFARLFLLGFNLAFFTIAGLYFHNGAEFFLLSILLVTMFVYDEGWLEIILCIVVVLAILLVISYPQPPVLGAPVSKSRVFINILSVTAFIVFVILFFIIYPEHWRRRKRGQCDLRAGVQCYRGYRLFQPLDENSGHKQLHFLFKLNRLTSSEHHYP